LASFYLGKDFLFSATVGKKGEIRVHRKSMLGRTLNEALSSNKKITVSI